MQTIAPPLPLEAEKLARQIRAACLRRGWDCGELAKRAGVSRTTVYHLERGQIAQPRRSTVGKIASALGLSAEELLNGPSGCPPAPANSRGRAAWRSPEAAAHKFDRSTNPVVAEVCGERPELVAGWSQREWDELYSSFGTGGALTHSGVLRAAETINRKRETLRRLSILLETHLAEVAARMVHTLYEMVDPVPNLEETAELAALLAAHRGTPTESVE